MINSGGFLKNGVLSIPTLSLYSGKKIELFVSDSFHPSLRVHSLSGVLLGLWAMRINYDQRLIFRFMDEAHTIVLLIDIGTHVDLPATAEVLHRVRTGIKTVRPRYAAGAPS